MVTDLTGGPAVPDAYLGVWKRTLLRTPTIEDTTTRVYWMQTQSWHADLRVRAGHSVSSQTMDQLSRAQLLKLAWQQGFCGTTLVDGNICRWLRRYDFQPPSGANDIGRMEFDGRDRVYEYGVEADYFEIWERLPESAGASCAKQLRAEPLTLLLATGPYFMLVRPRAVALRHANSLVDWANDQSDAQLRHALDFEISFGRWAPASGTGRVELSTLPWRYGADVQSEMA